MREFMASSRSGILVWILLTAGVITLGYSARQAVNVVLADNRAPAAQAASSQGRLAAADELIGQRQTRLDFAHAGERDPFRPAPAPPVVREAPRTPPKPRPEAKPVLRALLFGSSRPAIIIKLNQSESDWLQTGQQFKGWTVVEINPASATVTKGQRRIELRLN
jgi:hypothetical protein